MSNFGWGLTKKIETHGLARFKANIQRVCMSGLAYGVGLTRLLCLQSRQGFSMILDLIRQSRMRPMAMGSSDYYAPSQYVPASPNGRSSAEQAEGHTHETKPNSSWLSLKSWRRSS